MTLKEYKRAHPDLSHEDARHAFKREIAYRNLHHKRPKGDAAPKEDKGESESRPVSEATTPTTMLPEIAKEIDKAPPAPKPEAEEKPAAGPKRKPAPQAKSDPESKGKPEDDAGEKSGGSLGNFAPLLLIGGLAALLLTARGGMQQAAQAQVPQPAQPTDPWEAAVQSGRAFSSDDLMGL